MYKYIQTDQKIKILKWLKKVGEEIIYVGKNAFKVWKQLILEVLGVCKVMLDGAIALPYCKSSCDP